MINKLPRITVCIVVFNGRQHISDALASVANQSYSDLELIVIDGGSTDGTLEVLNEYAGKITKLVSEQDSGVYDAMNKACAMAHGDWLVFLGCDDALSGSLETIARRLTNNSTVYYGNVTIRSTGRTYGGRFSRYRLMQSNICHQAIFYPKAIYKTNSYTLKYRLLADYEYNLRLIGYGVKFEYMNIDVAIFNAAGASGAGDPDFELDKLSIIRQNFGRRWATLKRLRTMAVTAIKPDRGRRRDS
jgi:glycosyltransferase involved in cell wall biosynthesis